MRSINLPVAHSATRRMPSIGLLLVTACDVWLADRRLKRKVQVPAPANMSRWRPILKRELAGRDSLLPPDRLRDVVRWQVTGKRRRRSFQRTSPRRRPGSWRCRSSSSSSLHPLRALRRRGLACLLPSSTARRDLPGEAPAILAPAAAALLTAIAYDRVPVTIGVFLVFGQDHEADRLVWLESWAATGRRTPDPATVNSTVSSSWPRGWIVRSGGVAGTGCSGTRRRTRPPHGPCRGRTTRRWSSCSCSLSSRCRRRAARARSLRPPYP